MANEASYRAWVQSHTPLQIRKANTARLALKHLGKKPNVPIKDERLVKKPRAPYIFYYVERLESGDLKHMGLAEMTKQVSSEWNNLTEAEKEVRDFRMRTGTRNSPVNHDHTAIQETAVRR